MKNIVSGVQPTNNLTLGNYLGAIRNFSGLDENSYLFIADYHALTLGLIPNLKENVFNTLKVYLASGLNPDKQTIFLQSHVQYHCEMKQLLSYFVSLGKLYGQAQFKEKSENKKTIPLSLFDYPVLMAGDILLYNATHVPVGKDQIQHLELTRELAYSLNSQLGLTFNIPEPLFDSYSSKIMSLQNPQKKMSKSDPDLKATIFLNDSADQIINKFKKAITDSGTSIVYSEESLGVKNLIDLQISILNVEPQFIINNYLGKQYGLLKNETAEIVIELLTPLQEKMRQYDKDHDFLVKTLKNGSNKANNEAYKNISLIKDKMNFIKLD